MSVLVRSTRVALNTASGNQDITIASFGTPKAAIGIVTGASVDGTAADGARLAMGFTDGVRSRCGHSSSDHNVATTATQRGYNNAAFLDLRTGAGTALLLATFVSWITDGIRINLSVAPATAFFLTLILIGGTEPLCYVGDFDTNGALNGTTVVTAPGIEPHTLFLNGPRTTSGTTTPSGFFFGIADINAGVITQRSLAQSSRHGITAAAAGALFDNRYGCATITATNDRVAAEVTAVSASGFTVTTRVEALASTFAYLLVNWGTRQHGLATLNPPTSISSVAYTWPGWTPQALLHGFTHVPTVNLRTETGDGGALGLSVITTPTTAFCNAIADEDNSAAATDTQSLSDNQAVNVPLHTGAAGYAATLTSLDTLGYTLNYSAILSPTRQCFAWAVQEDAAVGGGGHPARRRFGGVRHGRMGQVPSVRVF